MTLVSWLNPRTTLVTRHLCGVCGMYTQRAYQCLLKFSLRERKEKETARLLIHATPNSDTHTQTHCHPLIRNIQLMTIFSVWFCDVPKSKFSQSSQETFLLCYSQEKCAQSLAGFGVIRVSQCFIYLSRACCRRVESAPHACAMEACATVVATAGLTVRECLGCRLRRDCHRSV